MRDYFAAYENIYPIMANSLPDIEYPRSQHQGRRWPLSKKEKKARRRSYLAKKARRKQRKKFK